MMPLQEAKSRSWHVIVDRDGEYLPPVTNVYANNTMEVIPRSEAEALAEALEKFERETWIGDPLSSYLARVLLAYRARHPREETP